MADQAGGPLVLLQLKAFGDFVIANAAAQRVAEDDKARLTFVLGSHLRPLCEAVQPRIGTLEIDTGEPGVPAVFDVRKLGFVAAAASAIRLRAKVAELPVPRDAVFLLDRIGVRERFLLGTRRALGMPVQTENIYHGYDNLMRQAGLRIAPPTPVEARVPSSVGIFPGSRVAAKNLPVALVARLMGEGAQRATSIGLYLLDGERPDLEASGLPHVIIPRQFTALRDAIASVDTVISADSLPAHFAESLGIASFVITPKLNPFWMPRSVFDEDRWALFDEPHLLVKIGELLAW